MTGFGRSHIAGDGREMFVELKSVNHRYLDINFRLPKTLSFLEETLREQIRNSALKRGHLEVAVTYDNHREDAKTILLDRALVARCAGETQALSDELQKESPSVYELIMLCGALTVEQAQEDTQTVAQLAAEAFSQALDQLQRMREAEGRALAEDLQAHLAHAQEIAGQIALIAPQVPAEYRERLLKRLAEWDTEVTDPARIAQEVALMADRCAIDEELSRLQSHFQQFESCFAKDKETGRSMDFLLQEMNREINTIGSKATNAQISACVVEMKSVLEKLREQVQNVE